MCSGTVVFPLFRVLHPAQFALYSEVVIAG